MLLVGGPPGGARCHGIVAGVAAADKGGSREKRATIFVTIRGEASVEVGKWLVMVVLKL